MTSPFRTRATVGLAALTCAVALAACSSGPTTPSSKGSATTSPPPGATDTSICQVIAKATTAYNAKDYGTWRSDMVQIANAAGSANYLPLKRYAEEVKQAIDKATTTTKPKGKPHSKSKATEGVNLGGLFASLGGFVGLQHVCAKLPSPGSTSSAQGASAQHGQSSVRGAGGHPPTQKGKSRGKVTVGF